MADVVRTYIENAIENLNNDGGILPDNKKIILDFHRHLTVKNYSKNRRYKYLITLPKMAQQLDKPFTETTEKDIEQVVLWVKQREDINEDTKLHYNILLKRFYKWLGGGEYPKCVKFISTTEKNGNRKLPEQMLTKKDVKKLLEAANNPRDRAMIAMLWETGGRIAELLDLTVGSLEDYKHGFKCVVNGKTGSRRLRLIDSVPYINEWLSAHPTRNKNDSLWVNIGTRNNGEKMQYRPILKMLKKVGKDAGIDKPINPHNFRHSRATYMANHFTEAQMCEWFGWVQGSDVPARYVHLSGRDIDDAYERMHGLQKPEEADIGMESIKCPRCEYENGPTMKFCGRCGMALDMETAIDADHLGQDLLEALNKNPELLEQLGEMLAHNLEKNG